jgi:chromosomal replication initiator protein
VPNRFKLDWIRAQYAARIEGNPHGRTCWLQPVRLELSVQAMPPREPVAPRAPVQFGGRAKQPPAPNGSAVARAGGQPVPAVPAGTWGGSHRRWRPATRLNPALTFDTLVPGRANQMARTAALHVAGAPGAMYNPLFIYGGVGLGKTHLIHAVGNALLKDRPDARVLYLHAEQFISDVVSNYQRKTFDALKAKYHALDLLLIDDVQFFAGKERTQEEFFNAFRSPARQEGSHHHDLATPIRRVWWTSTNA